MKSRIIEGEQNSWHRELVLMIVRTKYRQAVVLLQSYIYFILYRVSRYSFMRKV